MNKPMAMDVTNDDLPAQLAALSDALYEFKLLNAFLYDTITHTLHQHAQDNPERMTAYQGLLLFMQQLSAKSNQIEQAYEQLYDKLTGSSED